MNLDELKAKVRGANQRGVRLDGGGDDRPPVYEEDGTWVYRASTVGGMCDRALWLARMGVERSPTPDGLKVAYLESANNEQLAIDMFVDEYRITVEDQQHEFEIDVCDGVIVRGHVDGIGHDTTLDRRGVVEVKCIRADDWDRRSPSMYPSWETQMQLGMKGLGLPLTWIVYGRKVDGVVDRVSYSVVEYRPRAVAEVMRRIRRVEQLVADGRPAVCDRERWGCPYWALHEGVDGEDQEIEDRALAALAVQITDRAAEVRRAEEQLKRMRRELTDKLIELKVKNGVIVAPGVRRKVTVITPTRRVWDEDKLREDGVDLDRYRRVEQGAPYVRVEEDR